MTAPETMTMNCPTEETLAAFVEGRLNASSRQIVIQHMSTCAECRSSAVACLDLAIGAAAEESGSENVRRFPFRASIAAILAAAAVLIIAIVPIIRRRSVDAPTGTLIAATSELPTRKIDGWLSGGFRYKPYRGPKRGDRYVPPEEYSLEAAARGLIAEGAVNPTVDSLHASGVAHLLVEERDEAVSTLEEAVRRSAGTDDLSEAIGNTKNAELLSDLSAAYFARGKAKDIAADFTAALDAAERAWQLKQTPEIAWNRAIAASRLHLRDGAARAWDDFLRIARDPEWREEAARRRAESSPTTVLDQWREVEPQIARWLREGGNLDVDAAVARFPAQARAYLEDSGIVEWAQAQSRGEDAEQQRGRAAALAAALARTGEELPADAIAAIDRSCATKRCGFAAGAHVRYANAMRLIERQQYVGASAELEIVESLFRSFDSPYTLKARFDRITCRIYRSEYNPAGEAGRMLLADLEQTRYQTLHARSLWLVGLCELQALDPEKALKRYREAERLFEDGRDDAYLASIRIRIADALEFVGSPAEASNYRLRAFAAMASSGDHRDYGLAAYEAGAAALAHGRGKAGDAFLDETIAFARAKHRPDLGAMAALRRATRLARAGDFRGVAQQTRIARDFWGEIDDGDVRQRVAASAGAILGPTSLVERPQEQLTEAIDFFNRTGTRTWLPELLHQRAMMQNHEGDHVSAERDLREAIAVAEDVLSVGQTVSLRDGFAPDIRETYSALIGLLVERGRSEEALELADRARVIGRRTAARRVSPLERLSALPPGRNAVVYEVQPAAVIAWVVNRDGVHMFRSNVAAGELRRLTSTSNSVEPSIRTMAQLYDILVRPWAMVVHGPAELVIVPAPGLEAVPYAALYDGRAKRYVIDDFEVSMARSLTDFAGTSTAVASHDDGLLILADAAYRNVDRLPASRSEATELRKLYPEATVLLGREATAPRFLEELERATALHFGGHATINEGAPEMSALLVAGAGGEEDDGRVYVHELLNRPLPLKLVVLSACSTARTRAGDARGNITIAGAFLDGGANAVVATLWPVADDDAAAFSVRFHEAVRAGATPRVAVRLAQLHVRSRTGSSAWGAFCILQGAA